VVGRNRRLDLLGTAIAISRLMQRPCSFSIVAVLSGVVTLALPASGMAAGANSVVTVGVRKPGAGGGDGLPEMAPARRVDLDSLTPTRVERFDAQYGGTRVFAAVPLQALLDQVKAPASADLALLHFANGIVVPLPYRDLAVMRRLQPWVARGMHLADKGMTVGEFDPITGKVREYIDVPVVKFVGNKVVVAERWHPDVPARAEKDLSPWAHVDSLIGIELVNAAAYNSMFNVDEKTASGFALYRQSCQFCHGVRQVGAKFGWDFVVPYPVHKWRKPAQRLYMHVKLRRLDAVERGQMMPALKYMTPEDASAVWAWLESTANHPLRAYKPAKE
jgi:hypothetical protein